MKRVKSGLFALQELKTWSPAEMLLPEYSKAQFKDLEEYIVSGGEMSPIVISEDFRIVDGYNRWRMANKLAMREVECDVYHYDSEKDMEHHAIVLNSKRRHLSNIQVARAASRLSDILMEESVVEDLSPHQDAVMEQLVENIAEPLIENKSAEASETPVSLVEEVPAKVKQVAMKKASRKLRVSSQTVERVNQVDRTEDQQLISAMESKQVSVKKAAELAVLPTEERHQLLEDIQRESIPEAGNPKVVLNACSACRGRLKSCTKKLDLSLISLEKREELAKSVQLVIEEAELLLSIISHSSEDESSDSSGGDA
jgi:ParB-like chromosome segregation protein Spo0J